MLNEHLMPWRYVLDVADGIKSFGHDCIVLTDNNLLQSKRWLYKDISVHHINGRFSLQNKEFANFLNGIGPDAVYFPASRKSAISGHLSNVGNTPAIAYFPGSWLNPKTIWRALPKLPLFQAVIYLAESLIPGSLLVRKLKKRKTAGLIALSSYTAGRLVNCGWSASKIKTVPPGLDPIPRSISYSETFKKHSGHTKSKISFLYMGPPEKIRGIFCLLEAFDLAADTTHDIILTCLLRHDNNTELHRIVETHARLRNSDKVMLVIERLNRSDVAAFLKASDAVILPFLLVPSEIPLAVIESLAFHKPLIITECGGTSQFAREAAIVVPPNNIQALSNGIVALASSSEMRQGLEKKAKEIASYHPRWDQVSLKFLELAKQILAGQG